ncbi:MAG TPA: hypothetical protein VGL86_16860 [Polyangia bacterium]|jgi:hypothetical protein
MNDDELKRAIGEAHRDDAAPPFAAVVGRARRRPRPWALALPLCAAIALLILWLRPHAPPPPSLEIRWKDPLAFLLVPPDDDVLRSVPEFDTGGDL